MRALFALLLAAAPALETTAEKSAYLRTGRYDEAVRLCDGFAQAFPAKARCSRFGTTPEGRPMVALAVSEDGVLDPVAARRKNRPVVLLQGGIHAGEIDGKDAGFLALREMLAGRLGEGRPLAKVTAVFVPVFNVDGHERFGKNHRPNQVGPEESGWRVTAQNLNLNRDYVKAEAPEMRAMLKLLADWDPTLYADLHVTDGAQFQHDVAILFEPRFFGPAALREVARAAGDEVLSRMKKAGHLPVDFYPAFAKDDDPSSGFGAGVAPPRFSAPYRGLVNRLGVLVETHSWKPYRERVQSTKDAIVAFLELAARDGAKWILAERAADAEAAKLAGTEVPVAFGPGEEKGTIDFLGYAWKKEPSVVNGEVLRYDPSKPEVWKVPFRPEPKAVMLARVPKAGWLVPPAWAAVVVPKLELHGIAYRRLDKALPALAVGAFRASEIRFAAKSYEGRQTLSVKGAWGSEKRDVPAGAIFVPAAQARAALAAHLLDPMAPDSLAAWGFLNAAYERQEYIEDYVLEDFARKALEDPKIDGEWKARLADPAFAKDAAAREEFFYRRHPAYDERYRLHPIFTLDTVP